MHYGITYTHTGTDQFYYTSLRPGTLWTWPVTHLLFRAIRETQPELTELLRAEFGHKYTPIAWQHDFNNMYVYFDPLWNPNAYRYTFSRQPGNKD